MSLNLDVLILPLLGGYFFYTTFYNTKLQANRRSGYHLFFSAAFTGTVFYIIAFFLYYSVKWIKYSTWHLHPIISGPVLPEIPELHWIAIIAFTLSVVLALLSMFWVENRSDRMMKVIQRDNDPFEDIIFKAFENELMVSITTKSNKVYVGFILEFPIRINRELRTIKIMPQLSGYRHPINKRVTFTTDYSEVYKRLIEDEDLRDGIDISDFDIALPIEDIVSTNIFHPDAYKLFQEPPEEQSDTKNSE